MVLITSYEKYGKQSFGVKILMAASSYLHDLVK